MLYWRFSRVPELTGLDDEEIKQIYVRCARRNIWSGATLVAACVLLVVWGVGPALGAVFPGTDERWLDSAAILILVLGILPTAQNQLYRWDIRKHEDLDN